jgi:hypothetical protein
MIEGKQQEVEVDREGIHYRDLFFQTTGDAGEGGPERDLIGHPGIPGVEVAADRQLLPVLQFLPDRRFHRPGLQSQGVSAEINDFFGAVVRYKKPGAKALQLVLPVFPLRKFQRWFNYFLHRAGFDAR